MRRERRTTTTTWKPSGASIELHRVTHHYNDGFQTTDVPGTDIAALTEVTLAIRAGELLSVTGPSGSGKTTLLNLIGALATPTFGTVALAGRPLHQLPPHQLAEIRNEMVGFVFQNFNLISHLSVHQNVALPAVLARRPRRDYSRRVSQLLELVGMADKANEPVPTLSGGEQQRVAVARALVNDPPVILADEPTGNLDSHTGDEVVDLLQASHDAGRTVVIVTHDLALASTTQRILHLEHGRLTDESLPNQIPEHVEGLFRTDN
jgi:ABC-type lipoprotein export system ATPase subunit